MGGGSIRWGGGRPGEEEQHKAKPTPAEQVIDWG